MYHRSNRKGFTLIEVAIVVGMVGILAGVIYPSMASALTKANARNAQAAVVAQLAVARSAAVQRGRSARVVVIGNVLNVALDSAGTLIPIGSQADLYSAYDVSVSATHGLVEFDSRGMAVGLAGPVEFTLTHGANVKHVCVRRLGNIVMGACSA
ncbi:MAG: GspH/FimT family pseudopilin [Gemmatimonadota bacterium]|nr:GspH/FimT family pseudopilin [Gemmatimonadota bacterium]